MASGEFPEHLTPAEVATLAKQSRYYDLKDDEIILKPQKNFKARLVPTPANRFLFV